MRPVPAIPILNAVSFASALDSPYVDTCWTKASNGRQQRELIAAFAAVSHESLRRSSMESPSAGAMRVDWDVPIPMDDGVVLRCDVFAPASPGRYPVILTYGPYAKGLAFQDGY